jgi:enamine deaminase RidA (YjgF/YER057c/UK114 family)
MLLAKVTCAHKFARWVRTSRRPSQPPGRRLQDLVKTTTYVTDIDEFFQHVDVRMEYCGALPTSTTVEVRRLAHPDFMVEVEAIAVTD